jgi:cytochrome c oxidase subunit I
MHVIKRILSLGFVRAALAGLLGTGGAVGITMLIRRATGLPAWHDGPVLTIGILVGVVTYLAALGVFNYWLRWAIGDDVRDVEQHPVTPHWARYFSYDTNHKIIGIQYLASALTLLPFAIILQMLGRIELASPGHTIMGAGTYNEIISDHGIVMLFGVVIPAVFGMMNYLVPLLIGAKDMAFPRLNAFSFWLIPAAGLLMATSLAAGGFDTGWTVYPPLAAKAHLGTDLMLLGVYLSGLSSILSSINFLVTIFKLRAPGMSMFRMPIFVWGALATVLLSLVFTQFIAMSFLMVLLERVLGMGFFNPQMGGNVILYEYLFWFYSHPAVYVFVLVGLATIAEIIPVFARKPLFGYKMVALSSLGIAFGGCFVFGHHMFAAGMESWLRVPFMITTLLVAVPTGVKIFSWLATMWMGKLNLAVPFLFVLSSIFVFLIGGITGVPQGIIPVDLYINQTYYIVAHFHATLFGGFVFPFMAAIYYWFPKVTGRMLSERLGKVQWGLMTVGFMVLYLPMFYLGLAGMRRRVYDYGATQGFQQLQITTAVGGFILGLGFVLLFYNLIHSLRRGELAGANPWHSRTLEWQVSSPPPEENFVYVPQVTDYPYGYGTPGSVHALMGIAGGSDQADPERQEGS